MDKAHRLRAPLVFALCLEDLRHEKMLSFCMIMAVAAVLGPLLILFGLKFGTMEMLRERLVRDPRNVEMRPMSVRTYTHEWFVNTAAMPYVAFVVPYTRQLATGVEIILPRDTSKSVQADMIPTGEGDPLILQNGGRIPSTSQCLLTSATAEAMGASTGDSIVLRVRRNVNGRFETGDKELEVIGVLPIRAGAVKGIFVPLSLLEAVEAFKDGMAVPALGWHGTLPKAYPVFNGVVVSVREPLDIEHEFKLTHNTGFTNQQKISAKEARDLLGGPVPDTAVFYLLSGKGAPAEVNNIKALRYLLSGKAPAIYPLANDMSVRLSTKGHDAGTFRVVPASAFGLPTTGIADAPPWREDFSRESQASNLWRVVLVSPEIAQRLGPESVNCTVQAGDNSLSFPVRVVGYDGLKGDTVKVPLQLLGTLALVQTRPVSFDVQSDVFLLHRRGFAGFRLYASGLEKVGLVKKSLENQGITVHTEAERIDDVLRLDTYLTLIFWLIAVGALAGGAACLVANVYAGIERKQRELAVLRLLGLSGGAFVRFPLYTATVFAILGFAIALALFYSMAFVINGLFSSQLQAGESLCRLAWWHPFAALGLTMLVTLVAGLVAAKRTLSIEPADALRTE